MVTHNMTLSFIILLPGQQWMLQEFVLELRPGQLFPPQEGTGLLHFLVSVCVPPPHVLLHDPFIHELHPPSTTLLTNIGKICDCLCKNHPC